MQSIVDAYHRCGTVRAAAREAGVSYYVAQRAIADAGIRPGRGTHMRTEQGVRQLEQVAALRKTTGVSLTVIADWLGVSPVALAVRLSQARTGKTYGGILAGRV